jgi:hypothetical protein
MNERGDSMIDTTNEGTELPKSDTRGDEDEAHSDLLMQAAGMAVMSFDEALKMLGSES